MARTRLRAGIAGARRTASGRLGWFRGAGIVPRPRRLRRGEAGLALTHVLVACDLNPRYLDFWPLVRRAWQDVVGLQAVLVLVAPDADVPPALAADSAVRVFEPLAGVHTALQAQCIRLLYPALLEEAGGVLVSDMDMVPLSARYFLRPPARLPADHFVAYRNVHVDAAEIAICYNAARPRTWATIFGVDEERDVRRRLEQWAAGTAYAGGPGGEGWLTDQRILFRTLLDHGRRTRTVWILDDGYTGFRRLERGALRQQAELPQDVRAAIERGAYSDFHCLAPAHRFRTANELAVDLATAARSTSRSVS